MKIFFDCDETIITWDVRLRPGVKEVIGSLRDSGHEIYLWSGNGPRWEIVRRFDLHDFFLDCYWIQYFHWSRCFRTRTISFLKFLKHSSSAISMALTRASAVSRANIQLLIRMG